MANIVNSFPDDEDRVVVEVNVTCWRMLKRSLGSLMLEIKKIVSAISSSIIKGSKWRVRRRLL